MKIVLLKSVDNLGQAGEAVDVKRGYFRNYLGPRGMALLATPQNLKVVESKKKKLEALVAREKTDAEKIQAELDGKTVTFHLRAGDRGQVFGSVTTRDFVDAVKEEFNVEIERRRVDMENLKTLGDHQVRIRIYPGVNAMVNARVERLIEPGEEHLFEESEEAPEAPAAEEAPVAEVEAAEAPAEAAAEEKSE